MRQLLVVSGMAAVIGLGAGAVFQHWREVEALKAEPCFARKWDSTARKVVWVHEGMGSCFALSKPVEFEGVWAQGLESSTFSDGSWLSIDRQQQERVYRMIGAPVDQEPQRVHLKFWGSRAIGPGPYGHMGGFKSLIVVTAVEEARRVDP